MTTLSSPAIALMSRVTELPADTLTPMVADAMAGHDVPAWHHPASPQQANAVFTLMRDGIGVEWLEWDDSTLGRGEFLTWAEVESAAIEGI